MANTRCSSRAWGPTHPSAAFLIKCAKEREKLRSTLQTQLQEHMLLLLQNQLFSDIQIGFSSSQSSEDLQETFHSHKAILKIRVPTFYKHLLDHKDSKANTLFHHSYLESSELKEFLRKTYTDDDIRKYECEALRLSKKYSELLFQNKGPINKHIFDVDEFEKESVTSDHFVTPKSTPISPEKKSNVFDMFRSAENYVKNTTENVTAVNSSYVRKMGDDDLSDLSSGYPVASKHCPSCIESKTSKNCPMCIHEIQDERNESTELSLEEGTHSDQDFEQDDYSNVGSMVRSNTFDLETQGSLEEVIDDSIEWCSRPTSDNDFKEDTNEIQKDSASSSRRLDGAGFFLHDHTPSPKSNIFKHGFSKEPFSNAHEVDHSSPGIYIRRLDGSMSDSGFMSHSTFSVISDTGFPGSVSSSLLMSSDEISPSHISNDSRGEISVSKLDDSKHLSGSMFPFYIDINSLPSISPNARKDKKSNSPSHAYMYIDARSPRRSFRKKQSYLNTSYDEFFAEFESENHRKYLPIKAQSTSQLDRCQADCTMHENANKAKKLQPQSCYMYVDFDSVNKKDDNIKTNIKMEHPPISMFINLNDSNENSATSDSLSKETKSSLNEIKDNQGNITNLINGKMVYNSKRKLSDSSLPFNLNQDNFENNVKFFSLTKNGETRSASAIDYNCARKQESSFQNKKNEVQRESQSAHRYSDGVFYDNLYENKIFSNFCNQNDSKAWNDSKICQLKDMKVFNQPFKLSHSLVKDEESSGSCSNLGKISSDEKLFSSDKVKWKSTGDMGKSKTVTNEESGLLPMSPILRRKSAVREHPKSAPPPVIKASTKPQDVDAMTFPKSVKEDSPKLTCKISQDEFKSETSPHHRKQENTEESKNSNENSKPVDLRTDFPDGRDKNVDFMSHSGSSLMTMSGGDSSSDKPVSYEVVKEKAPHSLSLSFSCDFEDDSETIYSEVSDVSSSLGNMSGLASLEHHWRDDQHQHNVINHKHQMVAHQMLEACSKLGEDLLRMFLEEIDTDIALEVEGKEIKAHRCILASRCKYFANLLHTTNPDKNSSRISLEGFTFSAVHFALCHIYSGAMNIPKDCNISELALLADMLNLHTLTDVIVFHLKMHFCHFFHRPCLQCTQGVVECLPLAVVCGLNELRDKCIHWLGKYFTRTWSNKSFAGLTEELRDLCYNVTAQNIMIDSVIEMTLNCDRLMTTLPQLKWTEPIFGMVTRLLQDCMLFMAQHFHQVLSSESFLALGKGQSWNVTAMEEDILSSIELTTPDVACKSYVTVNQLLTVMESSDSADFTQNFVDLLHKISRHSERYLIQNANKVVHCESWACLAPQVQKRIKDAAVIVFEFEKPTAPRPRLSSLQRKLKKQNENEDSSAIERSTYPKKGKSGQQKNQQRDHHFLKANQDLMADRNSSKSENDNVLKKAVSPIKEEVQNNTFDIIPASLKQNTKAHLSNRSYIDTHEEDSLRDLQDLPQDQSHSLNSPTNVGVDNILTGISMEMEQSPAHCSDNPDSLEANDISSDSKEDADVLLSNEDGCVQEKGVIETPEVLNKTFDYVESNKEENSKFSGTTSAVGSTLPKSTFSKDKVPHLQPLIPHCEKYTSKCGERSPVKKLQGKSLVPLAKAHNIDEKSPMTSGKDLVAEIDADSKMVNHCLQEAEMLEQQLSRKLQRQHQNGSPNISQYVQNSTARVLPEHKNKSYGSRLQKCSSASQIKSLVGAAIRGKSPGRIAKSNASSPSMGHAPRIMRSSESREKITPRKISQSPKGSAQRSFRSMESIANVHKQLSVNQSQGSKRVLSKASRPRTIVSHSRVSPVIVPK